MDQNLMDCEPEQLIINEYEPGQGIAPHTDRVDVFDDQIISVSLGSDIVMDFINSKTLETKSILLKRRSLLLMSEDARYEWKHTIPARKSDKIGPIKVDRGKRVSLTFRRIKRDK